MNDKFFLDTNILIYYIGEEIEKQEIAKGFIYSDDVLVISTQVINEFTNVCFKKLNFDEAKIIKLLNLFINRFEIKFIAIPTIVQAIHLKEIYKYSYYDSLILSSALENNCNKIYSEDLKHLQVIENKIKIINPYN